MTSLISSVLWVPRGVSARNPKKYDLTDPAEVARVERLGKIKLDDARRDLEELEEVGVGVDGMSVDEEGDEEEGDWEDDDIEAAGSEKEADAKENANVAKKANKRVANQVNSDSVDDNGMEQYHLDNYDDEVARSAAMGVFGNIKGLSYYSNNGEADPFITLTNPNEEDADQERDELEILSSDNLLISAKTADDVSLLEVHVYENPDLNSRENKDGYEGNLYVHHDLLLPAMPLCLEWGDARPSTSKGSQKGNFVAVGTMDRQIEIWDLDLVDGLFPEAILGDDVEEEQHGQAKEDEVVQAALNKEKNEVLFINATDDTSMQMDESISISGKRKKKKSKKPKSKSTSLDALKSALHTVSVHAHTDSVLSLSWNRTHRSLIASSSADGTIKLWDISSASCQRAIRSFNLHDGKKVQSIQWNPQEPTVLLSGAWEGAIKIFDTRNPEASIGCQLPGGQKADVEAVHWDPHSSTGAGFFVSTGKGQVLYYDSRNLEKPLWTLDAHDGPVAALDVNEYIPGCIVTGGIDKQTKVWSIITPAPITTSSDKIGKASSISLVASRDFGVGKVFTTLWSPDDPTTVAIAGSNSRLNVWDAWTNQGFRKTFGERVKGLEKLGLTQEGVRASARGVVSVEEEDEPDSGGED